MRRSRLLAPALALALFACASDTPERFPARETGEAAVGTPACLGKRFGQVPITAFGGLLFVPVRFGDRARSMILDTGAVRAALFQNVVSDQSLLILPFVGLSQGVGGTVTSQIVHLPSFDMASVHLQNVDVPVLGFGMDGPPGLPASGLLGASLLSLFDIELDVPNRTMTLYDAPSCRSIAPPWSTPYSHAALTALIETVPPHKPGADPYRFHARLLAPVTIGGQTTAALLDTGAPYTIMTAQAAQRLGIAPEPVTRPVVTRGTDLHPLTGDLRVVPRLLIGDAVFDNVEVGVFPLLNADADIVLGVNLFRSSRLWLSFSAEQLFLANSP